MFSSDVTNLRKFYSTSMGRSCRELLARRIASFWPDMHDEVMLGLGYATPYATPYMHDDSTLILCMPAQLGAVYWPPSSANHVFMAHESELPLCENSINRILLIHAIENSEQLNWMMSEMWRVLTPGGRILAVVPNRMGVWSRSPRSPFGYGRPFSMAQLRDLFSQNNFTLIRASSALFVPPTRLKFIWRMVKYIEKIGKFLFPVFAGVVIIEAEKQLYSGIKEPVVAKKRYRISATKPVMSSKV